MVTFDIIFVTNITRISFTTTWKPVSRNNKEVAGYHSRYSNPRAKNYTAHSPKYLFEYLSISITGHHWLKAW